MAQEWREFKRRRSSKTRRLFVDEEPTNKYSLGATIGPMHYKDAGGEWQDIDTELVPSTRSIVGFGNPAYEMVENEYEMFVLGALNSGVPLVRYVSKNTDYWVQFAAHNLQWTNDLDQIDFIATPVSTATEIVGSEAKWPDAYGAGLDLRYIAGRGRMAKWLDIDSPLPAPPQFIIDGGNPCIEFAEILEFHGDLDVYIDGEEWNKRDEIGATTEIEFRSPDGEVQFVIPVAGGYHEGEVEDASIVGQLYLKKQGPRLYVTARFPWAWLQSAVYPVHLDTDVDKQVGAGVDDASEAQDGASFSATQDFLYAHANSVIGARRVAGVRFTGITIDQGLTIDVAHTETRCYDTSNDSANVDIHCNDVDNANDFDTEADVIDRARTADSAPWTADDIGVAYVQSPSLVDPVQEVIDRGSWASGNALCILYVGRSDLYKPFIIWAQEKGTDYSAKLHIEYSGVAAAAPTSHILGPLYGPLGGPVA